jgi:Plant protein of unknown function (DUF936)
LAREDLPQPTVEQFLSLHATLTRASLIADSLSKSNSTQEASSSDSIVAPDPIPEEHLHVTSDHRHLTASWVNAALSTDITPFTLYGPRSALPPSSAATPPVVMAVVAVDSPAATKSSPSTPSKSRPVARRQRSPPPPAVSVEVREWTRDQEGMEDAAEMARGLKEETTSWFLGFVERFLDADVADPAPWDRDKVAGMLSQLKRVNDWLDIVGQRRDGGEDTAGVSEGEVEETVETGSVPKEIVERLRKKIYEYLLTHVESAAAALSGGASTSATSSPTVALPSRSGGDRPSSRRS